MVEPCSLRRKVQAPISSGTLASQWSLPSLVFELYAHQDKKSIAWLTKHVWLLLHISEPVDDDFLVAPHVLLELDHDSWIILPLFSVGSSFSCALKDQQRLTVGKYGRLHSTLTLIRAFTCHPSPY